MTILKIGCNDFLPFLVYCSDFYRLEAPDYDHCQTGRSEKETIGNKIAIEKPQRNRASLNAGKELHT
jgi:hypothetical protein